MKIKDIVVVIVTFKSDKVIFRCLNCLKKFQNILILDNSNDVYLKKKLEKEYKNIKIYLSKKNLGYAGGNNYLLKKVKTKYALILNPDAFVSIKNLKELIKIKRILNKKFGIIGEKQNSQTIKKIKINKNFLYECKYVKGFFMLINMLALKKVNYFDDNFFMYMEEIDLCKRLKKKNYKIYTSDLLKIRHIGESSSNIGSEFEKNRNWHWMWSQFYFDKKHYGYFYCLKKYIVVFIKIIINIILSIFLSKKKIYLYRFLGLATSILGIKSYFRPNIDQFNKI